MVVEKHAAARRLAHGRDMPTVPDRRAAEVLDALQKLAGVGLKKRSQLTPGVAQKKFAVERSRQAAHPPHIIVANDCSTIARTERSNCLCSDATEDSNSRAASARSLKNKIVTWFWKIGWRIQRFRACTGAGL